MQLPDAVGGDAEDEARGAAVGESFAAAWLAEFGAVEGAEDPEAAARRALDAAVEERLRRVAVTEVAHAFSAERSAVMAEHARRQRAAGLPVPTKVWMCEEGGSCVTCFAFCGTTRAWDEDWTIGARPFVETCVPGSVHPNCACSVHVAGVSGGPVQKVTKDLAVDDTARAVDWPADLGKPRPGWARRV